MNDRTRQTEFVDLDGGRIAYDVAGDGPLVVLSPGMADLRGSYRFLAPLLVEAGYRVASVDLRGHGESSVDWRSYNHVDTANDLIAVVRKLGGPAVLVGQSFSGGAVTIAAATHPDLIRAIVEIGPFTRPPQISWAALLGNANYRRGAFLLARFIFFGSLKAWLKYLDLAFPGRKPADWNDWLAAVETNLREPDRANAARKMGNSAATLKIAAERLTELRCPALVIMGREDSDFSDPGAEAAAIVEQLSPGLGRHEMIDGAGHYPHAQYPREVADVVLSFLARNTHA